MSDNAVVPLATFSLSQSRLSLQVFLNDVHVVYQ